MFFAHAVESDPANANYRAIHMHAIAKSDPAAAAKYAEEVLADDENYPPIVIAEAAEIACGNDSTSAAEAKSVQLRRRLIPVLERTIVRIEKDQDVASRAPAYTHTLGFLGLCYEFEGNTGAAVNCYSRGIQMSPNSDVLLIARGILQYGTVPNAIFDFERAANLGSKLVWPYLFLAHHYLETKQFEQCRSMCEAGLRMRGSDPAKSQLEEWRGIAQAELGFPPELVRAAFETALRLDPSNELAKRNQDAFEASLNMPRTSPRSNWEQKSDATVRQFGLAERRYSVAA